MKKADKAEKTDKIELTELKEFNQNYNISYIENEDDIIVDNKIIIQHYLTSLIIYGFCLYLYFINPFFSNRLNDSVKMFYAYFYAAYVFVAPIIYFVFKPKSLTHSHSIAIYEYIKRVFFKNPSFYIFSKDKEKRFIDFSFYKPTYFEQQSIVLILIKFFFGALMVQGLFQNINYFMHNFFTANNIAMLGNLNLSVLGSYIQTHKESLYVFAITALYTVDLSVFAFGYLTELSILKNKIRSVETTFAGVAFCIICYSPFLKAMEAFTGPHMQHNSAAFGDINHPLTWTFRLIGLFFMLIYVCASLSLGTKASNLTNRGTVSRFPYNIVRHPAYISKNLFWILTFIPIFIVHFNSPRFEITEYINNLICAILVCSFYVMIYYFRALTEERHLMKDPEYRAYAQKVKYRFIPWVI